MTLPIGCHLYITVVLEKRLCSESELVSTQLLPGGNYAGI